MVDDIIQNLFVGVAIAGSLAILQKSSDRKAEPTSTGQYHLKMPMFYGILGVVGWAFGTFFLSMIVVSFAEMNNAVIAMSFAVTAMFFIVGSFCFLYYWNHEAKFDDKSIEVTDHYGHSNKLDWKDVKNITFGHFSGQLIIETADRKVKVHQHLSGVASLSEMIEATTDWTSKDLKLPFGK